jgi:hypothetical protein
MQASIIGHESLTEDLYFAAERPELIASAFMVESL